ncbi:hypothetical protein LTR84_007965 [Exophiala bonariae]|uniref:Delta(24)-sterol reductase n=1 Tax=Exophiala bonariae TaxID=1690606 RepID=A0AAV9NQF2_9EURO|nr:hypothetical protein LTR84_007965 [Exophiala bonariae]
MTRLLTSLINARQPRIFGHHAKFVCSSHASHSRYVSHSARERSLYHHQVSVEQISAAVRTFFDRKEKFRIFHGSTNSTRPRTKTHRNVVDTSKLNRVLNVDVASRTALVEPNVPMDRLVEESLKYGLVPPVVMEFPGITAGGGYAGTAGESSSFKHGFFDRTINFVEMVLADGSVIRCSKNDKQDLFDGAAGALGTLGITTLLELKLRPATKYVETTYHPVSSVAEAVEKTRQMTSDPSLDYVDGILFSKTQGAIITGRMTDEAKPDRTMQTFSGAKDPWFYLHVQDKISNQQAPVIETIPLPEYLFRYDRGGFWVGASAFQYFKMPFNKFTRWWLDDFLHTRMMYTALHASGQSRNYVVQDLALPYSTVEDFIDYTDEKFGIYPLWLCPLKQSRGPTMHPHSTEVESDGTTPKPMLNVGLWGTGPANYDEFVQLNQDLERKLQELNGMKWLYAHTYYSKEDFWQQFDGSWYQALREKYQATSLPDAYEKVKIDVEAEKAATKLSFGKSLLQSWPLGGFYGIKKAIESGSYKQARASIWKQWPHQYQRLDGKGK